MKVDNPADLQNSDKVITEVPTQQTDLTAEFDYLIEKIEAANFRNDPFRFIQIENFLSDAHFNEVITATEINRPPATSTENLIEDLQQNGYQVQVFPGCTTSIKKYLKAYNAEEWPVDKELLEGFGLVFRLKHYSTPLLKRLVEFLNTPKFKAALEKKFGIKEPNHIETAFQKYLHAYEISPHPDSRRKAVTYMLNLNTHKDSEKMDIHTHLLKFKPERVYIRDFWKNNKDIERCWVPWHWCESIFETRPNNSISLFAPSNDTLHAVKLNYDHLQYQRTQLYGNLWYNGGKPPYFPSYKDIADNPVDIEGIKKRSGMQKIQRKLDSMVPTSIKYRLIKLMGK
ncbi:hypothetical protein [Aquimarina celericrescens]|uniref:Prolyl 4-hydroxylase alpha subunit Fe(2+) 2OG dioxygenase domain-containing protein n=1 Tax=Aquimarina celericrescens TaxID=1964542 RepID=A0ABW5AU78_9FLAO|nr:hypothetical protein [Aquimarina celericrescens]